MPASKSASLFRVLFLFLFVFGLQEHHANEARPLVLAHYIPWFASKPISGVWGWHWTMNHYNPEQVLPNGQRAAASHDYPLLGLYDCSDPAVLECQVLQMKFAGIDGVIIDWYGTKTFNDYGMIHRNTQLLIPFLKRAGLSFALCYEDQSIKHMVAAGALKPEEALEQGKTVMNWVSKEWFADPSYVKVNGRPLLLVFGPQHFKKADWEQLWTGLPVKPLFFGMPHLSKEAGADGSFGWPPVTGGKEITPEQWRRYLVDLAARKAAGEHVISSVFPGFRDIYKEAALHESYGSIAERDGETFRETLELAFGSGASVMQIATWNDYGEGTVIEPTWRLGYGFLETLQKRLGKRAEQSVEFTAADLRLPQRLFEARQRQGSHPALKEKLDLVAGFLFEGRCREAEALLQSIR